MFCSIKVGLNSDVSQQQLVESLNREKIEFIQTSSGLCVKGTRDEIEKALGEYQSKFTLEALSSKDQVPPDVRAFMDAGMKS